MSPDRCPIRGKYRATYGTFPENCLIFPYNFC
jgi:hypothetical protein